jgi:hypothetical protein
MADDLQQPDDSGITAYHGSPHNFERFDMSKIGTGEGNQSYGHGLYFAQNEDVAKGYRDTLGGHHPGDVVIGDEKHPHWASRNIINAYRKLGYDNETAVLASHFLKEHKGDLNAAAAATWSNDKIPDSVADALFKTEYATPAGHMYEVNINAHPDHFLDWDKPFHEQSEHVKRSLRNVPEFDDRVARYGVLDPKHKSKISMGEFINRGVLPHSYDKSGPEFSNAYRAAGIKGVKYLDQGSRWGEKKDKTHNYVVFDDKLVNVKRKYAKGGSVDEYPLDADADEHKHSGGHMSWMSPDSFLDKAQEMRGDSDDRHAIKHFEKRIKEGDKLNPLALYPKGGQDGRHRATAAKHLGIDKIPVVQWPRKASGGDVQPLPDQWEDAYHATHQDVRQFDLSKAGSGTTVGGGKAEPAVFLTSDPENAKTYLGGQFVNRANAPHTEEMPYGVGRHYERGANIMPLRINTKDFHEWDYGGNLYDADHMKEMIRQAKKDKAPGIKIENIKDQGYMGLGSGKKTTTYVVLDLSRLRSRFAKFDPKNAKKKDLGAKNGGAQKADGGISYSGDFTTPQYATMYYEGLPKLGPVGSILGRLFPNPATTGAYDAYMGQSSSKMPETIKADYSSNFNYNNMQAGPSQQFAQFDQSFSPSNYEQVSLPSSGGEEAQAPQASSGSAETWKNLGASKRAGGSIVKRALMIVSKKA